MRPAARRDQDPSGCHFYLGGNDLSRCKWQLAGFFSLLAIGPSSLMTVVVSYRPSPQNNGLADVEVPSFHCDGFVVMIIRPAALFFKKICFFQLIFELKGSSPDIRSVKPTECPA